MGIKKFELDAATDLDKQKLPIKTVNGVSPDGNGDISINSVSGNAGTATKLKTARTISISGDATGSASFDGSADKSISVTLASSGVTAGTYNNVTVDAKGRVTKGSNTTFATVATSGSYNDLLNRPSIPATPTAYIKETWVSGKSWCRVWSDGWKEQGGYVTSSSTVTFHKAFSNTNYTVSLGDSPQNDTWNSGASSLTTTTVYISKANNQGVFWRASGF